MFTQKNKGKGLFLGVAFTLLMMSTVQANDLSLSAFLYMIPTTFTHTAIKTNTTVFGGYGCFGFGTSTFEASYDHIIGTQSQSLVQENYLGIYTLYTPSTHYKIGVASIHPQSQGESGTVGILGIGYDNYTDTGYKAWSAGTDIFGSQYTLSTGSLSVLQASPFTTLYLASPWNVGWFELTGKVNLEGLSDGRSCNNEEIDLKYNWDAFSVGAHYYLGQSIYGTYNGGFVVNNTNDSVTDGFGLSGTYNTPWGVTLQVTYQMQNLQPYDTFSKAYIPETSSFSKMGILVSAHF